MGLLTPNDVNNLVNESGFTPLQIAAFTGNVFAVQNLLHLKAINVDGTSSVSLRSRQKKPMQNSRQLQWTPLTLAALAGLSKKGENDFLRQGECCFRS